MKTIKTLLKSLRLPFLVLTPVCVLLGVGVVSFEQKNIDFSLLLLVLIGALMAHISVNTLNEYLDFKSGLDLKTKRTNFSGGSGALLENPQQLNAVLITGVVSLSVAMLIGLYFVYLHGLGIMPIGIMGAVLVISYTNWINKHPWLCLLAPGFGFGFLMVIGTQFALTGEYSLLGFLLAAIPFFLVNNLLLLNQYPDIQADMSAGRQHFPIVYGVRASNQIYALFLLIAAVLMLTYVWLDYLPALSLMALVSMSLALFSLHGANKYGQAIGDFQQYLAANVATVVFAPLLLALSILV